MTEREARIRLVLKIEFHREMMMKSRQDADASKDSQIMTLEDHKRILAESGEIDMKEALLSCARVHEKKFHQYMAEFQVRHPGYDPIRIFEAHIDAMLDEIQEKEAPFEDPEMMIHLENADID